MIYRFYGAETAAKGEALLSSMLDNRTLRPSRSSNFNDPFEFKLCVDVEAPEDIRRARFMMDQPDAPVERCEQWLRDSLNPRWAEAAYRRKLSEEHGVICFTDDWNHQLFWSHYASAHSSFCLGYDEEVLRALENDVVLAKVDYLEHAPVFRFFLDPWQEAFPKAVFSKSYVWAYEREVRMLTNGCDELVLPQGAIKEVLLGCRAPRSLREYCRSATHEGITFYEVHEVPRAYRLSRSVIEKNSWSQTSFF